MIYCTAAQGSLLQHAQVQRWHMAAHCTLIHSDTAQVTMPAALHTCWSIWQQYSTVLGTAERTQHMQEPCSGPNPKSAVLQIAACSTQLCFQKPT